MFSKVYIPATLSLDMFTDVSRCADIPVLPENDYFRKYQSGEDVSDTLPIPEELREWKRARFGDGDVLFGEEKETIYVIADSTKFGFALFTFPLRRDLGQGVYRPDNTRAVKQLTKFKEEKQMSLQDLASPTNQYSTGIAPMAFQPQQAAPMTAVPQANMGVSGDQLRRRVANEAVTHGFVYGYVMRSAPAISMKTVKHTRKSGETYEIKAVESRPSGMQLVALALPNRCTFRGGSLADPSDIMAGRIDFDLDASKGGMSYLALEPNSAVAYIGALGNRLPEYAPNVSDAKSHWTAQDILNGKPEVTFVYTAPVKTSGRGKTSSEFKFVLKTTSDRGSLFTPKNIMCLKAAEHISTNIKSDKDAFNVNMAAFGRWDCTRVRGKNISQFRAAAEHCPSTIWESKYTLDGQEVKGYGSVFFMNGSTGVADDTHESIVKTDPTYYPWYVSNRAKDEVMPSKVDQIINRVQKTTADGKPTVAANYVLWKDSPNHPMFKPYAKFADSLTTLHYVSNEKLTALGTRSSGKEKKAYILTDEAAGDFRKFMEQASVRTEIQAAMDDSAAALTLSEAH